LFLGDKFSKIVARKTSIYGDKMYAIAVERPPVCNEYPIDDKNAVDKIAE